MTSDPLNLSVERGSLLLYYCFDVGEEILLEKIERIFGEAPTASRLVGQRLTPAHVQYRQAPLLIELGSVPLETGKGAEETSCRAKLFDFGVVTIRFRLAIRGALADLESVACAVIESPAVQRAARAQLDRLLRALDPAVVVKPADPQIALDLEWEDYAIFSVERFDRPMIGEALLAGGAREIARVLRSDPQRLSESELADATRLALSYYRDELAVIDWNAAFLYDPRQSYDVPDVLEFAVVVLLELRAYDTLLDRVLDRAYEDLEKPRRFRLRPFAATIDYLSQVKLEVSEVIEKATNSLKLVGDPYLARIHRAAASRFHSKAWEESVREKLSTVESLYTLLHDRTQTRILLVLEMLIVVLFVIDILLVLGLPWKPW
jgi:hypothetical protein